MGDIAAATYAVALFVLLVGVVALGLRATRTARAVEALTRAPGTHTDAVD
jgi:hypothetical protein